MLKPTTVPDCSRAYVHAPRQQAASAANDGQAERMAFRVAQRSLAPVHVRRIAQAHGASGGGRAWHMPENELDARPGCAADALDQAVRTGTSEG